MIGGRTADDEAPFINMTPMVDVVLCLLVFFMAATRLYDWDERQFVVKVPQVESASPLTSAPRDLELVIKAPGQVVVDQKSYDLESLASFLRESRERYEDQGVVVRGDASLTYQDVADVLACCELAGIRNVRLPVQPRARGGAQPASAAP